MTKFEKLYAKIEAAMLREEYEHWVALEEMTGAADRLSFEQYVRERRGDKTRRGR